MQPSLAAILLAAGESRRMGRCKQLLSVGGLPAVVRCVETLLAAGVGTIVVVVGGSGAVVAAALDPYPVTVVSNPAPGSDMAASVRAGLAALGTDSANVFVALCDHPLVSVRTLAAMVARQGEGEIVIPVCGGRKGHPTLFPRVVLADIGRLATLREVIACHRERVRFLDVKDEGVVLDMDTPEDYERLVALAGGGSAGPR